jgi:Fe-S cluster assembly ATP-binding protein
METTDVHHKKGLFIDNLHVSVDEKAIINGITLELNPGEVHAVMGPNGSGKSTLAYSVMGHPKYHLTQGAICFEGNDIKEWTPDERARKGLFLAFQYPTTVPGVSVGNFLRASLRSIRGGDVPIREFRQQ